MTTENGGLGDTGPAENTEAMAEQAQRERVSERWAKVYGVTGLTDTPMKEPMRLTMDGPPSPRPAINAENLDTVARQIEQHRRLMEGPSLHQAALDARSGQAIRAIIEGDHDEPQATRDRHADRAATSGKAIWERFKADEQRLDGYLAEQLADAIADLKACLTQAQNLNDVSETLIPEWIVRDYASRLEAAEAHIGERDDFAERLEIDLASANKRLAEMDQARVEVIIARNALQAEMARLTDQFTKTNAALRSELAALKDAIRRDA